MNASKVAHNFSCIPEPLAPYSAHVGARVIKFRFLSPLRDGLQICVGTVGFAFFTRRYW